MVAQFGETVHLNCTTTQEIYIDWHHNSDVIYVNGLIDDSLRSKYSIDTSTDGEYTLVIHNVTVAEGGEYKCIDNAGQGPELVTYILAVKGKNKHKRCSACPLSIQNIMLILSMRLGGYLI